MGVNNEPGARYCEGSERANLRGALSLAAIESITRINASDLQRFLEDASARGAGAALSRDTLSADEGLRLSLFVAQARYAGEVDDDERLKGILESLIVECGMTPENIALLTRVDAKDVRAAAGNPQAVPPEAKLALALRGSYLINAANRARPGVQLHLLVLEGRRSLSGLPRLAVTA